MIIPLRLLLPAFFCALVPAKVYAQSQARSSVRRTLPSSGVQKLVLRADSLVRQRQFPQAQRLLEARLKRRSGKADRLALKNALADVHFAWGLHLRHNAETISWRIDFKWGGSDFEKSIAHFGQVYATDQFLRPEKATAALFQVGYSYIWALEPETFKKGLQYFEWASARYRKSKNIIAEANVLRTLGSNYTLVERNQEAQRCLERALTLYRQRPNTRWGQAWTILISAAVYAKKGDIGKQLEVSLKAAHLFREIKDPLGEGVAWSNAGWSYVYLNRYDKALQCFKQAQLPFTRMRSIGGYRKVREGMSSIAFAYAGLERYDQALPIFEKVVPLMRRSNDLWGLPTTLQNVGDVYMKLKRYPEAAHAYQEASEVTDSKAIKGQTISGVGTAYLKMGRTREALRQLNFALSVNRSTTDRFGEAMTLATLCEAYARQNQISSAIMCGKQAVNLIQEIRKHTQNLDEQTQGSFVAQNRETYERLAALLVKANRLEEAEQVLRFLRQQDAFEFVKRDPKLSRELAGLFQPLPYSSVEKKRLPATMAVDSKTSKSIEESRLWQKALQERDAMGEGHSALLSTFNTETAFYVILTTAKTRCAFSVPIQRSSFDALTKELQNRLVNPELEPRPTAQKLYRIVFCNDQLEQALQRNGITNALWFTSGSLHSIPLDALHDGKQYLVQKERVNTSVTLTSRRLFGAPRPGVTLAAGVSQKYMVQPHIKGDRPQIFNALSSVPQEVRSIVRDETQGGTGPFDGQILLDRNFTADNLKSNLKSGVSTVHIATHFSLNPGAYEDSFLLMGDGKTLPVSLWKQTLQLQNVNLLTLSACQTGVGSSNFSGGEVSSIGEVSQWLGAHSVIVSQWSVADVSTAILMSDFYKRWYQSPQRGKANALREAQCALLGESKAREDNGEIVMRGKPQQQTGEEGTTSFIKDPKHPYAHPYYWAPFSLIGNWK